MAESMTPGKDAMPAEERNLVLQRIAKVAKRQGNWQLAAKKYTQVTPTFQLRLNSFMIIIADYRANMEFLQ
jgi:hypothetical protein